MVVGWHNRIYTLPHITLYDVHVQYKEVNLAYIVALPLQLLPGTTFRDDFI